MLHHSVDFNGSVCDDALIDLGSHYASRTLFLHVLRVTSKSRMKFVDNKGISLGPRKLASDRSKAVIVCVWYSFVNVVRIRD